MSYSRSEDIEFEKNYKTIITNLLYPVLERINHKVPTKITYSTDNINKKQTEADKFLSIDIHAITPNLPDDTIQVKGRRFDHYKYFFRNPDMLISLKKKFKSGFECDGDYVKCNSRYYMYCFLNQEKTDVIYWALINWSKLRDKFNSVGGWENLIGTKWINSTDKDGTVSKCIIVPWFHIRDCLAIDKNEFDNPMKKLDDNYTFL